MQKKYIGYLVILIFVIFVVALAATSDYDEEDDPDTPDTPDTPDVPTTDLINANVTEIANAYVYNYDTAYSAKGAFYVSTSDNAATAGNSGGRGGNYVTFTLCKSEDEAKSLYDIQSAQYANKVAQGSAMPALKYYAYENAGNFTAGSGYYGEATFGFTSLHYAAYYKNVYVDSSLTCMTAATIADAPLEPVLAAMYGSIESPKAVTAETYATNFALQDDSKSYKGENTYTVEATNDKNASATYSAASAMGGSAAYGVTFRICDSESAAKELYDIDAAQAKSKVAGGSAMAGLTWYELNESYKFTGGSGYYGDINMEMQGTTYITTSLHYSGYIGQVYFTVTYVVSGSNFADTDAETMFNAIATAIAC